MELQGRRVDEGVVAMENPGDYCPWYVDGELAGVWMILPNGTWGRCANKGHGQGGEPEWTLTEDEERTTITVDPSIEVGNPANDYYWHGYLKEGVFTG